MAYGRTIKRIAPSKYKYVYKVSIHKHGKRRENKWRAAISNYHHGRCWSAICESERDAAIMVDKALLRIGRDPVNILKKK